MMPVQSRYNRLLERRAPRTERILKSFSESYERLPAENAKYLIGAMRPVDAIYTARLREQAEAIEHHLEEALANSSHDPSFRRQGSVANNTHIKYFSDIDVLVITEKFFSIATGLPNSSPYSGDIITDLLDLRKRCTEALQEYYPKLIIDTTGAKSISASGGNFISKADVVPANWYNTTNYASSKDERYRGVMVLDKNTKQRITNFPFLYNSRLDEKDIICKKVPKMMIRLLKTIKADHNDEQTDQNAKIDLSSFDLASIVYRMPNDWIYTNYQNPLQISLSLVEWLDFLKKNEEYRNTLDVIDDSRKIFDDTIKQFDLGILLIELKALCDKVSKENATQQFSESLLS